MASSENQGPRPKPRTKLLSEHAKLQMRENFSDDQVDSGIGSLASLPSDRSYTGSDSIDDQSRNQECSATPELIQKTAQLNINESENCKSTSDEGYISYKSISLENKEKEDRIDGRLINYHIPHRPGTIFDFIRLFAQTQDLRYVLAPLWLHLLHQNEDGDTSLHLAIINCNEQVILAILDVLPKRECFDIYNDLTQTPLHLAVITGQDKIVGQLIDYGASIDLVDRNGQTCIHLACQRGDLKSLRAIFKPRPTKPELREKLQDILEMRNFDGLTPLCVAVKAKHVEIVKELIMLGADVNAIDTKSGNTALHLAVEDNNLPMLSCLLFQGNANPNAMSYSGSTPLHIAAGLELEWIIATLIAVGANASIENLEGDTAFKMASESCEDFSDKGDEDFEIARESFDSSDDDLGLEEMEN